MVVYLTDEKLTYNEAHTFFENAEAWAKENCSSFIGSHIQDVADVSYIYDYVAEFKFNDPKDAMWFQLKWKNS